MLPVWVIYWATAPSSRFASALRRFILCPRTIVYISQQFNFTVDFLCVPLPGYSTNGAFDEVLPLQIVKSAFQAEIPTRFLLTQHILAVLSRALYTIKRMMSIFALDLLSVVELMRTMSAPASKSSWYSIFLVWLVLIRGESSRDCLLSNDTGTAPIAMHYFVTSMVYVLVLCVRAVLLFRVAFVESL